MKEENVVGRMSALFVFIMNRMLRAQKGCPPRSDPFNLVNQSFSVMSFHPLKNLLSNMNTLTFIFRLGHNLLIWYAMYMSWNSECRHKLIIYIIINFFFLSHSVQSTFWLAGKGQLQILFVTESKTHSAFKCGGNILTVWPGEMTAGANMAERAFQYLF